MRVRGFKTFRLGRLRPDWNRVGLTPGRRRFFLWAIFLLSLALVGDKLHGIYKERRERIAYARAMVLKYRKYLSREEVLRSQLREMKARLHELEKGFWDGYNPSLASAEIQRFVEDVASREGVKISSTKVLAPRQVQDLTRVSVQISMKCNVEDLSMLLYEIERHKKLLMVPRLTITSIYPSSRKRRYIRSPSSRSARSGRREDFDLSVSLQVEGFIRGKVGA